MRWSDPGYYRALQKPDWTPPSWLFGPVWTVLYAMMAVALWLVWKEYGFGGARFALAVFAVQLALNAAWTPLFFGLQLPGWALVDLCLMWVAILATIVVFAQHSRLAAVMLVPYLLWVSFAGVLNFSIWRLNC